MSAIECCKCHRPYSVGKRPDKALCPYCGAHGGLEIDEDVARQLILQPARMLRNAVHRKAASPYRSRTGLKPQPVKIVFEVVT